MHQRSSGVRLLVVFATCGALFASAQAQSKVATAAAQFLGIGVGPKAMAMGSAYVAMPNDVTALYWNPGSFAHAQKSQVSFSHTSWLVESKFRWGGVMINIDGQNAVGVSITHMDYGEDDVTTTSLPDGTGERWTAGDMAIGLSYSRLLTDRFSLGASAKYIEQRIWNETATTFAFDLGLLYITGFNDMRLGVAMTNFGGNLQLEGKDLLTRVDIDPNNSGSNKSLVGNLKTEPWPLPLFFRVGVAMDVVETGGIRATVAADAVRPNDANASVNVGTEISWNDLLFLRGGYQSLFKSESQETYSLGAGVKYTAEGFAGIEINYAYNAFGIFGSINTIEVGITF